MLCRATLGLLLFSLASPAERRVAITIDDLPVAQSGRNACELARLQDLTRKLLEPFRAGRIPLTGFVVAGNCEALDQTEARCASSVDRRGRRTWQPHLLSPGLNTTTIEEYERDILRADAALKQLLGNGPHPILPIADAAHRRGPRDQGAPGALPRGTRLSAGAGDVG